MLTLLRGLTVGRLTICLPVPACLHLHAMRLCRFSGTHNYKKGYCAQTAMGLALCPLPALSHYPLWEWVVSWGRHVILLPLPLPLPKPNPHLLLPLYHYHGFLSHGFDKGTFNSDSSQQQSLLYIQKKQSHANYAATTKIEANEFVINCKKMFGTRKLEELFAVCRNL